MYKDLRLFLNNVDITDQVIFRQSDLRIRQRYRDYRATIGLLIDITSTIEIVAGKEVSIKYTNTDNQTKTLFGGIIFRIDYGEKTQDNKLELTLDCDGYYPSLAARRTITDILDAELNPPYGVTDPDWKYYAGYLASNYVDLFLSQDGVTLGEIQKGRLLAETELEEFVTMSIKDIYDTLAEPSGDSWFIDNDKRFHFGSQIDINTYDSPEDTITLDSDKYTIKGASTDLTGFTNKIFIEGSEYWEGNVPNENLDINGKIFYMLENTESVNYFKNINGNTGVFGLVIRDPKIINLATAKYRAEKLLSKYPDVPRTLTVHTFDDRFKPGDKIKANIPLYGVADQFLTIHDITIEMASGKKPIYKMEVSNVPELGGTENLYQFLDTMNNKVTPPTYTKPIDPNIPSEPEEIGPDAYTEGEYFIFDELTNTITGYSDLGPKDIYIPPTINGVYVLNIGNNAFQGVELTSLKIAKTILHIGDYAFDNNKIESVVVPNGVDIIGSHAFSNNLISKVTLSRSLTTIGDKAFYNNKLSALYIPSSLENLGLDAFSFNGFWGRSGNISGPGPWTGQWSCFFQWGRPYENAGYTDASEFVFNANTETITDLVTPNPTDLIIPPTIEGVPVKKIGPHALSRSPYNYSSSLSSLIIPDSVEYIGEKVTRTSSSTANPVKLKVLQLGKSVRFIGEYAFANSGLTNMIFPNSLEIIEEGAFKESELASIIFGNGLKKIGGGAFRTNSINQAIIPDSVIDVGNYAFAENNISTLQLGEGLTSINHSTFRNNIISSVIISSGVKIIDEFAFDNNRIRNIYIPNNVLVIKDSAFRHNYDIHYEVSESNPNYSSRNGLLYSKDGTTLLHGGRNKIIDEDTIVIADNAFREMGVTSVTIPSSVVSIGTDAFRDNGPYLDSGSLPKSGYLAGKWVLNVRNWVRQ